MKLLLDENLSPTLVLTLRDSFPGSEHVVNCGLRSANDQEVWDYARAHGFVIVSKDSDFHARSLVHGNPPKVIWLRIGNCSTDEIQHALRASVESMLAFIHDHEASCLVIMHHTK